MRKLILASASVLALGIGGAGVSFANDMSNPASDAGYNMPGSQTGAQLSQNEVRQAQQQLRDHGLYQRNHRRDRRSRDQACDPTIPKE